MFQLRALVWKAYKVRLKSSVSSLVDILIPIFTIGIYLVIKYVFAAAGSSQQDLMTTVRDPIIRRQPGADFLDPSRQLSKLICTRIPVYTRGTQDLNLISSECGIVFDKVQSRADLVNKLRTNINDRIALKNPKSDLNKSAGPRDETGCYSLLGSSQVGYDLGLVIEGNTFDLYLTDGLSLTEINQQYTQSASFNEYRLPQSDLNTGLHLLQICLSRVLAPMPGIGKRQASNPTGNLMKPEFGEYKWRMKPFPITAAPFVNTIMFMMFILFANFINALVTIKRVADDRENGFHNYTRLAGVSASTYWLSHYLVILIHMSLQNLVIAVLLAIPVGTKQLDPIHESNITFRWLLLLSYSMAIQSHAFFAAILFEKTSQAVMTTCFLAASYCVYPLTFLIQWNPYGFSNLAIIFDWPMLTPGPLFQVILYLLCSIYLQTGTSFQWNHLSMGSIGFGQTTLSLGFLWLWLLGEAIIYLLIVIIIDEYRYLSGTSFLHKVINMLHSLCCCNRFYSGGDGLTESHKTKSLIQTNGNPRDPNRICCSLRHLKVKGRAILEAQTKGDPLRMNTEQLKRMKYLEQNASKAHHYVINRQRLASHMTDVQRSSSKVAGSIMLDDNIQQHIIWVKSQVHLDDVNLDFRYNQISFVLGHPDHKELLFNSILGTSPLNSGRMVIENSVFSPSEIHMARRLIGFLSQRDIYVQEMSIFDNLQLFGCLRDSSYKKYDSESNFILTLLHLSSRRGLSPSILTHRSLRKLTLAVSAVGHTKLLLLVEPTLGLRWRPRCQVLNLLKKYKSIRSIVVDTSDLDEAIAFGDRLVFLSNGKAEFDGRPSIIGRENCCGYWIVFEAKMGSVFNENSLKALEISTSDIFGIEKIGELDAIDRPHNELLARSRERSKEKSKDKSLGSSLKSSEAKRSVVILKTRNTPNSHQAICKLLKINAENQIVGNFRLVEVNYQSLEDVLVLKMSKASYPELPPDLLLSLTHRSRPSNPRETSQSSPPSVSVREVTQSVSYRKNPGKSVYETNFWSVIADRLNHKRELLLILLSLFISLIVTLVFLLELHHTLGPNNKGPAPSDFPQEQPHIDELTSQPILYHSMVDRFYKNRAGLYLTFKDPSQNSTQSLSSSDQEALRSWRGNRKLSGTVNLSSINSTDAYFIVSILEDTQEVPASLIFLDRIKKEATLLFEPNLPHAAISGLRLFDSLRKPSQTDNDFSGRSSTQRGFFHPWHEMIRGYSIRRLFYGAFITVCESIALAILILPPMRHREGFKAGTVRLRYWIGMAACDICIAAIFICSYVSIIVAVEGTSSPSHIVAMFLTFFLYRLAILPFIYLVSLTAPSALIGGLFIWLIVVTMGYVFAIQLKTFIEWAFISGGYLFTLSGWMLSISPISPLVDALVAINHVSRMNELCPLVPAYTSTKGTLPPEGPPGANLVDLLLTKVNECLARGKEGVSTDVYNQQKFGILWELYLIILFGLICWLFLIFSERFYGFFARRSSSARTNEDPIKTLVRSSEPTRSLHNWDREKDRLVSDYIRCLNEPNYVKIMSMNCLVLRIWMKPMADQTSPEKRIVTIIEPLNHIGQHRSEIQIELKTTLQLFIRLGNETVKCACDKTQLIEAYLKFAKANSDLVLKFAVLDWTQETMYKILLHGHYNTKYTLSLT